MRPIGCSLPVWSCPSEWLIEHHIGSGRLPARVHTGQCGDTRTRCKPATADQARRALTEGVSSCTDHEVSAPHQTEVERGLTPLRPPPRPNTLVIGERAGR
ncbi:DUF6233 domain-containing protein [Streptomyces sp. NPDC059104]|uniref:DUF6233 domain-containing protein n=1 Tax=Streptomyces sp. NPDC059104 TaxID=3346729 RepID=UPI0036C40CB8